MENRGNQLIRRRSDKTKSIGMQIRNRFEVKRRGFWVVRKMYQTLPAILAGVYSREAEQLWLWNGLQIILMG